MAAYWLDPSLLLHHVPGRDPDDLLQIDPNNEEALLFAAEAATGEGDPLLARAYAATALILSPTNADARSMWDAAQKALRRS